MKFYRIFDLTCWVVCVFDCFLFPVPDDILPLSTSSDVHFFNANKILRGVVFQKVQFLMKSRMYALTKNI